MKVRVKLSRGSPSLSVEVEASATVEGLKEAVSQHANLAGVSFALSLNGREPLVESKTLHQLGVVSGDLLHVMPQPSTSMAEEGSADLESGPMASMERRQEPGNMESGPVGDTKDEEVIPHATGMEVGPVGGMEQGKIMPQASGMESGKAEAQESELESDPMNQEELESDPTLSVHGGHYEALLEGCVPVTLDPVGVLCLALHSLMLDSGFLGEESASCCHGDHQSSGVYRWCYSTAISEKSTVALVCTRMGQALAIHASASGSEEKGVRSVSCSAQLTLTSYVDTSSTEAPHKALKNTQQLSRVFKDAIAHKILTEIRKALGLPEVGTFMSLFPELKLLIMRHLDVKSLVAMATVCRELHVLSQDQFVWRDLLLRDFGRVAAKKDSTTQSWKEVYIEQYRLRREARSRRKKRWLVHIIEFPPRHRVHPPPELSRPFPGSIGGDYSRLPPSLPPIPPRHPHPHPQLNPYGPLPHQEDPRWPLPLSNPPLFTDPPDPSRRGYSNWRAPSRDGRGGFGGMNF